MLPWMLDLSHNHVSRVHLTHELRCFHVPQNARRASPSPISHDVRDGSACGSKGLRTTYTEAVRAKPTTLNAYCIKEQHQLHVP